MASATLNLNVVPRRMLKPSEAATYCCLSGTKFKRECPVDPIEYECGDRVYDIRELDKWLDTYRGGSTDIDEQIGRL